MCVCNGQLLSQNCFNNLIWFFLIITIYYSSYIYLYYLINYKKFDLSGIFYYFANMSDIQQILLIKFYCTCTKDIIVKKS
jgi:hypothetical protein